MKEQLHKVREFFQEVFDNSAGDAGVPGGDFVEGPSIVKETYKDYKPPLTKDELFFRVKLLTSHVHKKEQEALRYIRNNKTKIVTGGVLLAGNLVGIGYIEHQNARIDELEHKVANQTIWEHKMAKMAGSLSVAFCIEDKKANWLYEEMGGKNPDELGLQDLVECRVLGHQTQEDLTPE